MRNYPFLLILLLFAFHTSCDQKHNRKNSNTSKKEKIVFEISDKDYIDSLSAIKASEGNGEFVSSIYKLELPEKPENWTNDYEGIFTQEEVKNLNLIISNFEAETSVEIAVVTIDSRWTTKDKFDSIVTAIGNYWGVGKKEENNGIVIGISRGLKMIRISNGLGIETKLSDMVTKEIIEEIMIPYFKEDKYYKGIQDGLIEIMKRLR